LTGRRAPLPSVAIDDLFVSLNLSKRDQTMPYSSEVHARVTKVLVQALGVEEDDIKPSATLQGDLGAESIDFLDITFRLEREFLIKIPHGELLPAVVFQDESEILRDGRMTNEGVATLRSQMPYADWRPLERDRRLNRIYDLFTVDLLSSYIAWKLDGSGESDSNVSALAHSRHCPENLTKSVNLTGS
jgi:acyl carrier protein